jgi:outer membrane protein OmpA-like peptidoglycan-associated protein
MSAKASVQIFRAIGVLMSLLVISTIANDASAFSPYMVLFETGSAEIIPAGRAVIDQVVDDAKHFQKARIVLIGDSDRAGLDACNLDLSIRRAESVRDALIAAGVSAELISVQGRGESEPAIPTDDGVSEQSNRRVVIIWPDLVPEAVPALPAQ